jgi:Mannosyltransferase (PIG-V)
MPGVGHPGSVSPHVRLVRGLRPLVRPLTVYLLSRIAFLAVVQVAAEVRGDGGLLALLHLWDGNWYLSAARGYTVVPPVGAPQGQSNIAFFPLFPMSIRALSIATGGDAVLAAVAAVHLYGIGLTIALWSLVRRLDSRRAADRTIALFWFSPGAAALSMVYAESVLLTFAVACLLALLSRRWILAGGAAALAGAARPNGVVLVACCLWQSVEAVRRDGNWRALVAPAVAPLGLVAYFGYLWIRFGDLSVWFRVQREGWGARMDFGWNTLQLVWITRDPFGLNVTSLLQVLGFIFVILGCVALWHWRPPAILTIYTVGVLAIALLTTTDSAAGARPRFVLTAFPLIIALARTIHGRAFAGLLVASAITTAFAAVVYTTPYWVIP